MLQYPDYMYLKKYFFTTVLLLLATVFTACGPVVEESSPVNVYVPKVETLVIQPGFTRELTMTGEVQAVKSATLTAEVRADVRSVLMKIGKEVQKGQTLIVLSSASVSSAFSTAQSAYSNAKSSNEQTKLSTWDSITSAQIAFSTAETNLINTLQQNVAARLQAEEQLNSAKLSLNLSIASATSALDSTIFTVYPVVSAAIAACDEVIGVSEVYKYANDSYEQFLGVFKSSTKPVAKYAIEDSLEFLVDKPDSYNSAFELLQSGEDAVQKTLDVLNNSTTSSSFPQSTLNTKINIITSQLTSIRGSISTLNSVQKSLESVEQKIDSGDSQIIVNAQAVYNTAIAQIKAREDSAQKAVESARAALEGIRKNAQLSRINADSSLDIASGSLDQSRINREKLIISAPFSGVITSVLVESGDEVSIGTPLISIEDSSQLKIVTYLSADEIKRIKVGDDVKIATQSYDKISSIAPSADPATKKYKVEILHQNPFLSVGEFVRLRFQVSNDVSGTRIFVPITAVNILSTGSFVWVAVGSKIVKMPVEFGEIEGGLVEITKGLEPGDEIISSGGRIFKEEDEGIKVEIINK